jgi:hypothetical protein
MSDLAWSGNPPAVPGVYWMRLDTGFVGYVAQVLIVDGDMTVRWIGAEGFSYSARLCNMLGSQWCGPMVPQQEVEQLRQRAERAEAGLAAVRSLVDALREHAGSAEDRSAWTTRNWMEHVGGREDDNACILFGSGQALAALLAQFACEQARQFVKAAKAALEGGEK